VSAGELITAAGQLQFRDLLLGMTTNYNLTKLVGWEDLPPVDIGSRLKPRSHGADPGLVIAQGHTITATFDIDPLTAGGTAAARSFLRGQTGIPAGALQEPIAVCLDPGVVKIRYGQLKARNIPIGLGYEIAIRDAVLQWECSDPRLYSSALRSVLVKLPIADVGSGSGAYPQNYAFAYAGVIAGGGPQPATNAGNAPTPPVYTITGPATAPAITINDADGSRRIVFNLQLAEGEQLVIDVLNRTVTLGGGASRYGFSSGVPIENLSLLPGTSTISLDGTGNTSTSLTVAFRDADI
jgi:hypothetical protein